MLRPDNKPHLPTLLHAQFGGQPIGIDRMIVAYHRAYNLKNILFPRTLREAPGFPASAIADALASNREPNLLDS